MSQPAEKSFEWLRTELERRPRATADNVRDLIWADGAHSVAATRNSSGAIEIFIVGGPLHARTAVLKDCLHHQTWASANGQEVDASRMLLPETSNLPGVAAFICAELLANGVASDAQLAFSRTEQVIAMLLQRETIGSQVLIGLAGELLLIDALTRRHSAPDLIADSWHGHAPSSRDLQLGDQGIEVKATTGSSSIHMVQGFHQVEVGHPVGDEPESSLHIMSIGFRWLPPDVTGGTSIPDLTESVTTRLSSTAAATFLARLRQYGGDAGVGYDHANDGDEPRFSRRLLATFERLYDMTDERIHVMRSRDVEHITHIDPASVAFRITLPRQVNGDLNPVSGLDAIASHLLQRLT